MRNVALSENAVAVLRFRVKGHQLPPTERRLAAYRELVDAGIMVPVPGMHGSPKSDFDFTEAAHKRREEILDAAEAHLRSLEPRLPAEIALSRTARKTLTRHLAGETKVTDANRDAYRELARAGIMIPVSTFIGGPEALFRFTWQGCERRHEFQRRTPRFLFSASAISRSLFLAVSRMAKGVSGAR
jgi:hypothetical protein